MIVNSMLETSAGSPDDTARSSPVADRPLLNIVLVAPPYFDVPPAGYGGIEAVVADLADALVADGHSVTLLGAGPSGTTANFVPLWERSIPDKLGHPLPEVMHAALVRDTVLRLIGSAAVDVVHDHTLAGPLNAPAFAAAGVPTVVTVHGPVDGELGDYYRALGAGVNLVAISDRQRQLAPDLPWVGRVYNALRLDSWPFRTRKDDYALFLGRFHPDKAPHLALEAAHAAGLPLVMAGKCTEPAESDYFQREIAPRMRDRDTMFGVADAAAKRELLAGARCLLFTSQWEEPFGMVMIEAMACGTPVVALHAGAVPEVVVDGVTGVVCDDPNQLAAALDHIGQIDPQACRDHVRARFSIDRLAAGYTAVYRRCMTDLPSLVAV